LQCAFVAFFARDQLGRLIVVGIVAMMFTHGFQNMGMNILMTPITGIPLPFMSYGGTFLVVCMFLMGMVQSVWIHRNFSPVKRKAGDVDDEEPVED
jgi:rod shape determining protein RodA